MRISDVKIIEVEGPRRFEYIELGNMYKVQCRRWCKEYGITLPTQKQLTAFGRLSDLRIIVKRLRVLVVAEDTSWIEFEFDPGFITDFASVPKFFRGIIDQDDNRVITAALCHDYLFSTHDLPFRQTNKLFHALLRKAGYGRLRARLAYLAVASPFGRYFWSKNKKRRERWTRKTAQLLIPRSLKNAR